MDKNGFGLTQQKEKLDIKKSHILQLLDGVPNLRRFITVVEDIPSTNLLKEFNFTGIYNLDLYVQRRNYKEMPKRSSTVKDLQKDKEGFNSNSSNVLSELTEVIMLRKDEDSSNEDSDGYSIRGTKEGHQEAFSEFEVEPAIHLQPG
ncbi:hypothetical protein FQR65_LT08758 [Abscondita terminalis]|nr:hypothetical protein FQR65_LT08758 [Abscondita terminalis]